MYATKITKETQEEYEARLKKAGEDGLYRYVIGQAILHSGDVLHPDILILDTADAFFAAYRRTGNDNLFTIGRILRRAAHRLYRELHKMRDNYPENGRFLRLVK
jgi:hypothetical protein